MIKPISTPNGRSESRALDHLDSESCTLRVDQVPLYQAVGILDLEQRSSIECRVVICFHLHAFIIIPRIKMKRHLSARFPDSVRVALQGS